jgi:hypothetical protein
MSCSLVDLYKCFGETCCLHLPGRRDWRNVLPPWRWRQHMPWKQWLRIHGITS